MSLKLSGNLFPSADKIRAAVNSSPLQMIDRSKLMLHPRNEEIYSVEVDELFLNSIADNGIIEPLIVIKNKDDDKYTICSGNRRFTAVNEVISRNIPLANGVNLDSLPCIVWNLPDYEDADVDLLINANLHNRKKTDGEIAKELAIKKEILLKRKSNGEKINGRIIDILAEQLEITAQQAKRLNAINIKATDEVKEAFSEGKISTDTAYQLSKASPDEQNEILSKAEESGEKLTAKAVKEALEPESSPEKISEPSPKQPESEPKAQMIVEEKQSEANKSQIDVLEYENGTVTSSVTDEPKIDKPSDFRKYTDIEPQPKMTQVDVVSEAEKNSQNEETDDILSGLSYLIDDVFSFEGKRITITKEEAQGIVDMLIEIKEILE